MSPPQAGLMRPTPDALALAAGAAVAMAASAGAAGAAASPTQARLPGWSFVPPWTAAGRPWTAAAGAAWASAARPPQRRPRCGGQGDPEAAARGSGALGVAAMGAGQHAASSSTAPASYGEEDGQDGGEEPGFDEVLANACAGGRWETALRLLDEARSRGIQPAASASACSSVVAACGGSRARAEDWDQGLWARSLALLLQEVPRNLSPQPAAFNTAAAAALDALPKGRWRRALDLFTDLRRRALEPGTESCGTLVSACNRGRRWEHATWLLADMRRQGVQPSPGAKASALFALGRADPWKRVWPRALDFFYDKGQALAVDEKSYNAAIAAVPGRIWPLAVSFLSEMRYQNLKPGVRHYTSAISACSRGREWRAVLQLMADMNDDDVQRDVQVYNIAMFALMRGGAWQLALELFTGLKKSVVLKPNAATYNTVINSCKTEGNWARALELWFEMSRERITPDLDTYIGLLRVSEECQRWGWSRQLLDTLYNLDAPRNVDMYNAAINACRRSKSWQLGLQLLKEMRNDKLAPTTRTFADVVELCEEGGRFDQALRLLEESDELNN